MDCNDRLHEGIRLHHTQINLESSQMLRYQSRVHQLIKENLQQTRRHQYRPMWRVTCSRSRKSPNRVTFCLACCSTQFYSIHLKDVTQRWQKKKGMAIYLRDHDHDCLTNLRFSDDVLLFATSKEQLQNFMYDFKESTETVGLRIHPGKTKVLSNQSSLSLDSKKEMKTDDIKIETLTRSESVRYLGQLNTFQQQETTEIKNRIRAAWATFHKYGQEQTAKNNPPRHRLRLFYAAITPTTRHATGTRAPTKEHEGVVQSAQRKMRGPPPSAHTPLSVFIVLTRCYWSCMTPVSTQDSQCSRRSHPVSSPSALSRHSGRFP